MLKVCVGVFTYNHASFIRQALDSVLAQKTNFPFEVLVHDDCSTDGTREIVQEYIDANPSRVRAILHARRPALGGVPAAGQGGAGGGPRYPGRLPPRY